MKVRELIEELQKVDPELEVAISDYGHGDASAESICVSVVIDPDTSLKDVGLACFINP